MNDGPVAAPTPASASTTAEYARIYEEQQPRLVAFARSLTRNSWAAEDLVAEAHFRVWRRLSAGHEIDNVPAYLMTTVRHLAAAAGTAVRETPQDPQDPQTAERTEDAVRGDDPAEQVSSVDLLVRVLGQLPDRWVKALWLAEAEGQPLAAIGPQIGIKQGATAVLLHRAREGMRQAFLREQLGAPDDPACEVHWVRMPAYVRGSATARQSERLLGHVDACEDCRGRLAVLMRTNDRLPALVGPALLVFALGGAGKFLLSFAAGSAGAATAVGGKGGGLLQSVRGGVNGGSKVPTTVVSVGAAVVAAAAIFITLASIDPHTVPIERTPVAEAPVAEVPVTRQPTEAGPGTEDVTQDRGTSAASSRNGGDQGEQAVRGSAGRASSGGTGGAGPVVVPAQGGGAATGGSEPEPAVDEQPDGQDQDQDQGQGQGQGHGQDQDQDQGQGQGQDQDQDQDQDHGDDQDQDHGDDQDQDHPGEEPETPGTENPGTQNPGAETPGSGTPATPSPAPAPEPVPPTPAEPTPVEEPPTPPETSEPTPADPAPAYPSPDDPTPADPTPADPTPADPTPPDPAPADPGPAPTPDEPPAPPGGGCGD
ncbi:sigma-70 family RNA polymerase sigma factor [Streptomyces sp. HUAS ZL42]|uniref:sigma-70 family RNA polymerase sigma factor n=1 Tax=Streptomyces sp. HUAS ZL42 TaxID=3231715 RepID=UPI00345F0508